MFIELLGSFGRSCAKPVGICLTAVLLLCVVIQDTASAAQDYTVTDLGTLGGRRSQALDINNKGQIVGWSYNALNQTHAFLWEDGEMKDLGTLGGTKSTATDINDAGQVVGTSTTISNVEHAFLWEDNVMKDLGALGPGGSSALVINEASQIAGRTSTSSGKILPFIWHDGTMTILGDLRNNDDYYPRDINENGQIVLYSFLGSLIWEDGLLKFMPRLPGTAHSSVIDINNLGKAVGENSSWVGYPNSWDTAVSWENGTVTDIGIYYKPRWRWNAICATAINDLDQIVGYFYSYGTGFYEGLIWEDGEVRELGSYLKPLFITEAGLISGEYYINGLETGFFMEGNDITQLYSPTGLRSRIMAVNEFRQLVGYCNYIGAEHATLWEIAQSTPNCPEGLALDQDYTDGTHTVTVSWSAPSEGPRPAGYKVLRDGAVVCDVPHDGSTTFYACDETGLDDCTEYCSTVVAYNSAGDESEDCASACIVTTDETAPSVPANLVAATASGTEIALSWDASTDNCDGAASNYYIYDCAGNYVGSTDTTSYIADGLANCTEYCFRVSAIDSSGNESAQSEPAAARTPLVIDTGGDMTGKCGGTYNINSAVVVQFTLTKDGVPVTDADIAGPLPVLYYISADPSVAVTPRVVGSEGVFKYVGGGVWQINIKSCKQGEAGCDGDELAPGEYMITAEPNPAWNNLCEGGELVFEPRPSCDFTLVDPGSRGKGR